MSKQDDDITVIPQQYEKSGEIVHEIEREDSVAETIGDRTEPNDEELATLRRVSETIPVRAWYEIRSHLKLILGLL